MCSLDTGLEKKVDQMEITTGVVIPVFPTLHTESNRGRQRIGTGVLAGCVPGLVIGSKRLTGNDTMLKGAMSKVGVILERHADDDNDDEDSSWATNSFYLSRSRTIPEVV